MSELVVADAEEHRALRAQYRGSPVHYVTWGSDDPDYDFLCVRPKDAPPHGGFMREPEPDGGRFPAHPRYARVVEYVVHFETDSVIWFTYDMACDLTRVPSGWRLSTRARARTTTHTWNHPAVLKDAAAIILALDEFFSKAVPYYRAHDPSATAN